MSVIPYTYPEVGATRDGYPLPHGYHHVRSRRSIGTGQAAFAAVAAGLMTWEVHRGCGLRIETPANRATVGTAIIGSVGIGRLRLRIPCRVVWILDETDRVGFAYGTLPGHPESGEESFVVNIDQHNVVWFTITAFSRPASWYATLGGPAGRYVQRVVTRRYTNAARRIAAGK